MPKPRNNNVYNEKHGTKIISTSSESILRNLLLISRCWEYHLNIVQAILQIRKVGQGIPFYNGRTRRKDSYLAGHQQSSDLFSCGFQHEQNRLMGE